MIKKLNLTALLIMLMLSTNYLLNQIKYYYMEVVMLMKQINYLNILKILQTLI